MRSSLYAMAGAAASAQAAVRGFNYASQGQTYDTYVSQFQTAAGLVGADDFTSARLYTMIQDATSNTVISAIPAAIATKTTLLLGLWASETQDAFDNELTALKNAISQYGSEFADLVVGISVGSEDLYRTTAAGIASNAGTGQTPEILANYIGQVRSAIEGTVLSSTPVGHVDTWETYTNSSNAALVSAVDFFGLDEYPYYQTTDVNDVNNGSYLFFQAYDAVAAVAGGKPIWITESGWPVSGSTENLAVPSTANAEIYWQTVACELISRDINTWWYILSDSGASPSFGVTSAIGDDTPLYNLACNSTSSSSSSSAASSKATSVSSVAQATTPSSAAASVTVSKVNPVPSGASSGAAGTGVASSISAVVSAAAANGSYAPTVYVTDVVSTTITTCPVGQTITANGSTTVLTTPSVITSVYSTQATISTSVAVGAVATGAAASSGAAAASVYASGSGYAAGAGSATTLASGYAAGQTPSASGTGAYTGAASKMDGSMAALALGAVAAVFAL